MCSPDVAAALDVDALAEFASDARADGDEERVIMRVAVSAAEVRADSVVDAASVACALVDADAVTVEDGPRERLIEGDAVKDAVTRAERLPPSRDAVEHAETGGDRETDVVRGGDAVVRADFDSDLRADADRVGRGVLLTVAHVDGVVVRDGDAVMTGDFVVDGDALAVFSLDGVRPVSLAASLLVGAAIVSDGEKDADTVVVGVRGAEMDGVESDESEPDA